MSERNPHKKRPNWLVTCVVSVCLTSVIFAAGCSSPEQQVSKAQKAYQQHDYHAAEVYLKSVLRKHSDNGKAWALLGHTSLARHQYKDAIHQFDKAQDNGQTTLSLPLGRALVADGQYKQALKVLQSGNKNVPGHTRALITSLRGDAQLGLGHPDQAAKAYASALSIKPGLADALEGQARLALKRGDTDGAQTVLTQAVSAHPDHASSLMLLGQLNYRANRCDKAIKHLSHAVWSGDGSISGSQQLHGLALLAVCQLRKGKAKAAQKNIDVILKADQNNPLGNYLQALMDIRQGQYRQAANHLQATLNVAPHNLRSMTLMAWVRIAQGHPDKAQIYLTQVLKRAPDNMTALRLQAGLWVAENQGDRARDLLEKAYQRHPAQPGLHKALSAVMSDLKRHHSESEQGGGINDVMLQLDLVRSLAQAGSDAAAQTVLAKIQPKTDAEQRAVETTRVRIALASGDGEGAIQSAESLTQDNPDDSGAWTLLAQSYAAAGRYDEAADVLGDAHKANPDDAAIVRAQARLAVRRGHYKQAIDVLAPLQQAHPDDTGVTLSLAGLYARAGKTSEGIRLLQSAVSRKPKSDTLNRALARAYLSNGRADKAMPLIQKRLKASGGAAGWLHLQGVAQLLAGQTDAGLQSLEKAADKAPDQPKLGLDVAKADWSHGKSDAAIERLQQLRQKSPDFWAAAGFLALLQADAGNLDAAFEQVSDLRDAGHAFDADVLEGDVQRVAGRFKQADAAYAKAYQRKPSRRLAMERFKTRRVGHLDDPAKPLEQWLADTPGDTATKLRLAGWHQQNNQPEQAAELYKKVLSDHPETIVALNNLALIDAEDDPRQAIAYAKKAHDKAPDSAAVADTLGWLLVSQGQLGAGIDLLEEADQKTGKANAEIQFHLGAALAERGRTKDKERSKKLLNNAISSGLTKKDISRARDILKRLGQNSEADDKMG